eukprot:scaffold8139_cov363-Prasinococcus_capsulatus_cf.AAC.5
MTRIRDVSLRWPKKYSSRKDRIGHGVRARRGGSRVHLSAPAYEATTGRPCNRAAQPAACTPRCRSPCCARLRQGAPPLPSVLPTSPTLTQQATVRHAAVGPLRTCAADRHASADVAVPTRELQQQKPPPLPPRVPSNPVGAG